MDLSPGHRHSSPTSGPMARLVSGRGRPDQRTACHRGCDDDTSAMCAGRDPDYSFEAITRAIRLIDRGARFIATNPDATGPSAEGALPATGSFAALITQATGIKPYFVGKPNPLMMRSALNRLEAHSETTVMIGDRMDTDIISGLEAGLRTVLVTTGRPSPTGGDVPIAEPGRRLDRRPGRARPPGAGEM